MVETEGVELKYGQPFRYPLGINISSFSLDWVCMLTILLELIGHP
jgi:hypothetical protein